MFQQDNYIHNNNYTTRNRINRQPRAMRVPPINNIPPLPKNLDQDDPILSSQQYRQIFQVQSYKLSPVIGNRLDDKKPRQKNMHNRQSKTKLSRPTWKTFIHPDLDSYYQQVTGKKARNNTKRQYRTPIAKHDSQYTQQFSQNVQNQQFQLNMPISKSNNISSGNEQMISTKNKSTVQNEPASNPNQQVQNVKKIYQEKINVLEHQNTNLKDQLFYLRAAILAHYQSKSQKSTSQKSL